MRVAVLGGGPAGLYFALLMKRADPSHQVLLLERNGPDDTFGWGVVFSDQTLGNLRAADPESFAEIARNFARWDDIDIHFRGRTITSGGHGFVGIARRTLLQVLQRRALELGAELRFHTEFRDDSDLESIRFDGIELDAASRFDGIELDAASRFDGIEPIDLVVAADGVKSAVRRKYAEQFQPDQDERSAKYIWLGTRQRFAAFTFAIVENEHGVFQAHAYRFDEQMSAFIVECDALSWRQAGWDRLDIDGTLAACQEMFAPWLGGHPLLANLPPHQRQHPWASFVRVKCERWHHGKVVLVGDAAHTAHFSIGSGTKLAMEDSIALVKHVNVEPDLDRALAAYQEERMTEALRLQNAARNSMEWFENVKRYTRLEPEQFAYSLLTRSQRVSHENLRLRDGAYLGGVERWFASRAAGRGEDRREPAGAPGGRGEIEAPSAPAPVASGLPMPPTPAPELPPAPPPLFTSLTLRGMTVQNRVVVAPMDLYSAEDGTPNDFHLVHLGARALGGAGLLITEMTCVAPEARISLGCTGLYRNEHVEAWRRIVDFVHGNSGARICLQLGHAGGKGSTRKMWEGMDEPLPEGNWPLIGPSPIPWSEDNQVPREMTRADMDEVLSQFVRAAELAIQAGFDMLELHAAHGYLLSSFLTPLANQRTDEFGGPLENRLRFPLQVFRAMRAVWPRERPMSVRISATDWVPGGIEAADSVSIAQAFHQAGADILHVSAGQTSRQAKPTYGRMFQTPFSDRIRNETGIPTIAVGNITEPDQVNSILAAGRADLCALARPHLADPHWTLRAAAELGYREQPWPVQYRSGKQQLERNLERAKQQSRQEQMQLELRGSSTV